METGNNDIRMLDTKPSRSWTHVLWIPLLWIVLCAAFYWEVIWVPTTHIVGGNDLNNMFRIWLDYARTRIADGHLPLWNPFLFAGHAFINDPQPALFYPPTWLSFLFSPNLGLSWSLVLHIWWAAVGCTFWLRSITDNEGHPLSWISALTGSAVFAFSGHTFARIQAGHIGVITTGSWLPWVLWALNILARKFNWRTVGTGALCIGFALLAGHTATFIYIALLWGVYTLMLTWHLENIIRAKFIWMAGLMGLLGVLLASVQLLPMLESMLSSTRLGSTNYAFASRFSWPVGYLITLFIPNFFGEPVRTGYWGEGIYDEMIFYVGLLPMLLVWVTLRFRQSWQLRSRTVFWLGVAGVSLLSAFGSFSILHRLLYRFIPLFSNMRAPARAGFLFTCSAAALSAFAVNTLSHVNIDDRQHLIKYITPSFISIVLGITAVLVIAAYGVFAWGRDSNPEAGRFWHMANEIAVFGLFFTLASGWLHQWMTPKPSNKLTTAALIIVLLDLWTLGSGLVQVVPAPLSGYWNLVDKYATPQEGRVLPWGLSIFEQNGALSYNIRSVFGYNPVEDANYNRFITSQPDPRAKIYDLLNVTHVSTTVPLTLAEDDSLTLLTEDNGVFIYNRSTALPRVWTPKTIQIVGDDAIVALINEPEFDPLHTVYVESEVECQISNTGIAKLGESTKPEVINAFVEGEGGVIVFSERYTPGWQATIDGEKTSLFKAYGLLQALCIPPGEHQIQLHYRPPLLIWGVFISALSLTVCGLLFVLKRDG